MSNGARHGLGILVGVVLTAAIGAGLLFGVHRFQIAQRKGDLTGTDHWIGIGVLAVTAVLIGILAGSRVSPIASLIAGLVFTADGVLWAVKWEWADPDFVSDLLGEYVGAYLTLGTLGIILLIGVALLLASFFPSRWRAREEVIPTPRGPKYEYGTPAAAPPLGWQPYDQRPPPQQAPAQQAPPQQEPATRLEQNPAYGVPAERQPGEAPSSSRTQEFEHPGYPSPAQQAPQPYEAPQPRYDTPLYEPERQHDRPPFIPPPDQTPPR